MSAEKRRFMRFNVLIDAICKTASGALKKMKINNFSKEGLGLLCEELFNKGEQIEIELIIPGDNMPVFLQGEIAWSEKPAFGEAHHKGGVKLKKIGNDDRSKILEYIYRRWIMPPENNK